MKTSRAYIIEFELIFFYNYKIKIKRDTLFVFAFVPLLCYFYDHV